MQKKENESGRKTTINENEDGKEKDSLRTEQMSHSTSLIYLKHFPVHTERTISYRCLQYDRQSCYLKLRIRLIKIKKRNLTISHCFQLHSLGSGIQLNITYNSQSVAFYISIAFFLSHSLSQSFEPLCVWRPSFIRYVYYMIECLLPTTTNNNNNGNLYTIIIISISINGEHNSTILIFTLFAVE